VDGPRRLKDRHLKMSFRQDRRVFRAIAWNAAEREVLLTEKKESVDLAFSLEENEFQGEKYLEMRVEDFR
jgi:single-stranded-DNA-specific exonuclease